jgi:hypothetical protein
MLGMRDEEMKGHVLPRETAEKLQKAITAAAGEHFVMYRLLRKGFIAALAPERAPNIDS